MRFFKHLMATMAILAVTAFSLPVFAQTLESLPARDNQAQRVTGKLIDFSGGNSTTTTYDTFDFGFTSESVRLCIRPGSATVYLRLANAVTTSPTALFAALAAQRATAPVSSSAAFITGAVAPSGGAEVSMGRALPLASGIVSPATAWTQNSGGFTKECTVFPLRGPGLVMHVVSGLATVEAWAVGR